MLKKVALDSFAIAFANIVFPLPGGPNSNKPRDGARSPVKSSGLKVGSTTISSNACFASC